MNRIHPLPQDLVSKIAAGEVIERPAYAVKELIENSLDAGATRIDIILEESGLQKICVHDNGEGMSPQDMKVSFLPHTTSKLLSEDDFARIATLGFRGEALNSIAAIARVRIQSRQREEIAGFEVVIENGKLIDSHMLGMPEGTSVIVEDLFSSTPVRKKFLKSKHTELRFILDIVSEIALAWPSVAYRVENNKRLLLDVPAGQEYSERLESLFGDLVTPHLLPISIHEGEVVVHGFISKPLAERLPQKQHFIVNKRRVEYQLFSNMVKLAYGSLLEPRRHPFVVLYFTLPAHHLDVNIHPRKEQLHMLNERSMAELLQKTVLATLQQNNLTYMPQEGEMLHDGGTKTYAAKVLRKEVDPWGKEFTEWKQSGDVLQVHNLYLIVQTRKGIMMVDQHAAHERILYEQFMEELQNQKDKKEQTQLKKAVVFEVNPGDAETIREYLVEFEELGFDIEEFGTNLFKITTVPKLFQDRDPIALIVEVVQDFRSGLGLIALDQNSHRMVSYLACRTAIKSGDKLTKEQARELIKKLESCQTQYTCPHGRPVKVEVTTVELEKIFRRR